MTNSILTENSEEEISERREMLADEISDLMHAVASDTDSTTSTIERMNREIESLQAQLDAIDEINGSFGAALRFVGTSSGAKLSRVAQWQKKDSMLARI